MTRKQYLRLVGWKLRQKGQRYAARLISRRITHAADKWARGWRLAVGPGPTPLPPWLSRDGAGDFWLPISSAPEWARCSWTELDQEIADATVEGRFDLLGSGPVELGSRPRWRRDLYSGYEWPLVPSHRISFGRNDGSDIRTVWELSRSYHFLALARACWRTGDERYAAAFVRHVDSWIDDNPLGLGPHWASPMDAGIRAANWIVALLLFARVDGIAPEFWERMLANLYATGLFLERHLEWHPVYRGNHFVSNGVGLVYLGTFLRDVPAGARWLRKGAAILSEEILRQVGNDGVSFEASLAYHRLDTEFFAYAGELLRRNLPDGLPGHYDDRLRAMYRFIVTYLPPGGEAPMLGDADDGRLHAVSARGWLEPRRHALGLPDGYWPGGEPASEAFPLGGFYVLRSGDDHAVVRCGPVGLAGAGSHDHNDQLSFELVMAGRRVVADSGTYAYTRDLRARYDFRSTAAHSVVQIGGEEQNPIRVDRPWRILADRTRAECLKWAAGSERLQFEGRHRGYTHRPSGAVCERQLAADLSTRRWKLHDTIVGQGSETLAWRLHLGVENVEWVSTGAGGCTIRLPGEPTIRLCLTFPPEMKASMLTADASDRYGQRRERPCLTLEGEVILPAAFAATFEIES